MKRTILLITMFILCASFVSAITTEGLVSYWSFDNVTQQDQVGDNDPIAPFGCTFNTNGALGNSTFCNTDMVVYNMSKVTIPAGGNFTQVLWFNYTTIPVPTGIGGLWSLGGDNAGAYGSDFNNSDIYYDRDLSGNSSIVANYGGLPGSNVGSGAWTTVSTEVWHMVGIIYDGTTLTIQGTENGVVEIIDNQTIDIVLDKINGVFNVGGRNDDIVSSLITAQFDEMSLWNRTLTHDDLKEIYNGGIPLPLADYTEPSPPQVGNLTITLLRPTNNSINNSNSIPFTYNVISHEGDLENCSLWMNSTGEWHLNQTNTTPTNNSDNTFFNVTLASDNFIIWNVGCVDNNTNESFATSNFTLSIDPTNPIIIVPGSVRNNQTVIVNAPMNITFNFTDNREIFSVNITLGNGTIVFNISNIGANTFQVNTSIGLNEDGSGTINAKVCDSSTLQEIEDIEYKEKDSGLKYVMKKWLWIFDDEWIHIYPKEISEYSNPHTTKQMDRYVFTFIKDTKPITETFVVESSHRIDIPKMQHKIGHLVVDGIGKNGYWVDFVNEEVTDYVITRIDDYKVEVTLYGLTKSDITFNSLGELNCVNESFAYGNANPKFSFENHTIVSLTTLFHLNISEVPTIQTVNATLYYNNTPIFAGSSANFTRSVTAPLTISGNSTNISWFWSVNVNGVETNLSTFTQNVSEFFLGNCSDYETETLNYTIRDELNNSLVEMDVTGNYKYDIGTSLQKDLIFTLDKVETFQLCLQPSFATLNGNYTIKYETSNYPQRRFSDTNAILTNLTQDISLFGLETAQGIFVRFLTTTVFGSPIPLVEVSMAKGGTVVEQEVTDDSGLATFFADPDADYVFTFSKPGFVTQTFTLRPTTSEIITVVMQSVTQILNQSTATGILYNFFPTNQLINNNTITTFKFNLTSNSWNITGCTLRLRNGTTEQASSSSSFTGSLCDISINLDTNGFTTITSQATYQLNFTDNITVSKVYAILNTYQGDFSLKTFFDDVESFGEAGFNDVTRMIIALIVIFSVLAVTAAKVDALRDPEPLIILAWAMVFFFSFLGWFTLTYDSLPIVPGFNLQKYIIFIVFSLAAVSYIIKRELF